MEEGSSVSNCPNECNRHRGSKTWPEYLILWPATPLKPITCQLLVPDMSWCCKAFFSRARSRAPVDTLTWAVAATEIGGPCWAGCVATHEYPCHDGSPGPSLPCPPVLMRGTPATFIEMHKFRQRASCQPRQTKLLAFGGKFNSSWQAAKTKPSDWIDRLWEGHTQPLALVLHGICLIADVD